MAYYIALKKPGVPVEMHLYAQGGHAFGLRRSELPIRGWRVGGGVAGNNRNDSEVIRIWGANMIYGYAHVSTGEQSADTEVRQL